MSGRILEIIKKSNLLSKEDFARASEFSQRDQVPVALFVLRNGMVSEDKLMEALSAGLGDKDYIKSTAQLDIDNQVLSCVPKDIAMTNRVIPITRLGNNLIVAVGDPTNLAMLDNVAARLGTKLRPKLASELWIQQALEKYYVNRVEESQNRSSMRMTSAGLSGETAENYVISYIDRVMAGRAAMSVTTLLTVHRVTLSFVSST